MKPLGSVAAVIAAIREDAASDVDAIVRQADADITRLRSDDATRPVVFVDGEPLIAAARERARMRLAQEDWLDTRAAIDERDAWLARAVERGTQHLDDAATTADRRERLARLTREGIDRLHSDVVEVVVSGADASILDEPWRTTLIAAAGLRSLTVASGGQHGGCLVRTTDGRASFDNTYQARIDRFRTVWRATLAEIYERAVQRGSGQSS